MADNKKPTEIILGSGFIYAVECANNEIPEDATFEVDANIVGLIQGGATFVYTPTYYTAKDDMEIATKTVLTAEEAHLKGNLVTVQDKDPFSKLCSTAQVIDGQDGKKTIKIGGIANFNDKTYVVRFVHQDKKHRITLIGVNQAEISIGYTKDKETVIAFDYLAQSMDDTGVKAIYEDTTGVTSTTNASDTSDTTDASDTAGTTD